MSSMPKSAVTIKDFSCDLPDDVSEGYDQKYLLLFDVKAKRHVVLSRRAAFHSDILALYRQELSDRGDARRSDELEVHGGGILQIDEGAKHVKTFGKSGGFGAVQASKLKIVQKCLEIAFPEAKIEVTSTNYVRD